MRMLLLCLVLLTLLSQACQALYVAEVYFVIDDRVVQNYIREMTVGTLAEKKQKALDNIQADVKYFVAEVNHLYSGTSLGIEIRSRKLNILGTDIITGSTTEKEGLTKFDTWLTSQNAYATYSYDLAVFWTGYDLLDSTTRASTPSGLAHLASVCNGQLASAIVEFDGTYRTAYVTAHEIGHILGSDHDKVSQGYIMSAASTTIGANRWKFSTDSLASFMLNIGQSTKGCLQKTNAASVALSGPATSALQNPDIICQRATRSPESFMLKSPSYYGNLPPQGNAVCREIVCQDPNDPNRWLSSYPSEGLTCGANKICRDGSCISDASAGTGSVNPNCIWGDEKVFTISVSGQSFVGSCGQFITKYGGRYCTVDQVSKRCCGTCAALQSTAGASANCPNGDQKTINISIKGVPFSGSCTDLTSRYGKEAICKTSLKDACCATCSSP